MLTNDEVHDIDPEVDIVIDKDDPDSFFFIFKSGPNKGVAFVYDKVNIIPNTEQTESTTASHYVEFNFFIIENTFGAVIDEDFQVRVGDLLVKMIDRLVEKSEAA